MAPPFGKSGSLNPPQLELEPLKDPPPEDPPPKDRAAVLPETTASAQPEEQNRPPPDNERNERERLQPLTLRHETGPKPAASPDRSAERGTRRGKRDAERWAHLQSLPSLKSLGQAHVAYIRTVLCRFSVSPAHWLEDLTQEVLMEAQDGTKSTLEARPLLFGIARHTAFRWAAKRTAERNAMIRLAPTYSLIDEHSVEDAWQRAVRRAVVHAATNELPALFRELFARAEIERLKMPVIAYDLGIAVNTGYTRMQAARLRFISALQRTLARRRVRKEDLSAPVLVGASCALQSEEVAPDWRDAAPPEPTKDASPPDPPEPDLIDDGGDLSPLRGVRARSGAAVAAAIGGVLVIVAGLAAGAWLVRPPDIRQPEARPVPEPHQAKKPATSEAPTARRSTEAPIPRPSVSPAPPRPRPTVPPRPKPTSRPDEPVANAPVANAPAPSDSEGLAARSIIRLARLGQHDEAQRRVADFQSRYPKSAYWGLISESLALRSNGPAGSTP